MKANLYAIENPDLVVLDEFNKNLYIKLLCTVVEYENNPSDMQVLYLKRIIKGIGLQEPIENYMRKAMEVSDDDIKEFIDLQRKVVLNSILLWKVYCWRLWEILINRIWSMSLKL